MAEMTQVSKAHLATLLPSSAHNHLIFVGECLLTFSPEGIILLLPVAAALRLLVELLLLQLSDNEPFAAGQERRQKLNHGANSLQTD